MNVGHYETRTDQQLHCKNPGKLPGRVGDHAGLTRQEVALLDAPAHQQQFGAA